MIIGITGGIASGKSVVSNLIIEQGYSVIDADQVAREIISKDTEVYREIVSEFGEEILDFNGDINRKILAAMIFKNEEARMKLNQITHPPIRKKIMSDADLLEKSERIVFLDIPLLFETGYDKRIDKSIVVYTSFPVQLRRLMERDNIGEAYARNKIAAQMPLDKKKELADFTIDNNGTIMETKQQLKEVLKALLKGE